MSTGCATTATDLLKVAKGPPGAGKPYSRGWSSAVAVGVAWDSVTRGLRAIIRSIAVVSRPKIMGDNIARKCEDPVLMGRWSDWCLRRLGLSALPWRWRPWSNWAWRKR